MKKYLLLIGFLTVAVLVSEGSLSHSPPQKATVVVSPVDIDAPYISTGFQGYLMSPDQYAEVVHFVFIVNDTGFNDPYLNRSERWRRSRNYNLQGIFHTKANKASHLKPTIIKLC